MRGDHNFQTPPWVCDIMVEMIDDIPNIILEPTPGLGNLVNSIKKRFPDCEIIAPNDIYQFHPQTPIDWVVSNPPFTPMNKGFEILQRVRRWCKKIIVLLPWFSLINSRERTNWFLKSGLCEVIHLPRSVFKGSRVQTCIMKLLPEESDIINLRFAGRMRDLKSRSLKEVFE